MEDQVKADPSFRGDDGHGKLTGLRAQQAEKALCQVAEACHRHSMLDMES